MWMHWCMVVAVHWYLEWQAPHCSMTGYLIIMGGFKFDGQIPTYFLWLYSNLSRAVSWSLLDSWCLFFGLSDDGTWMQWRRGRGHTCIRATTFRYDSKHQTMTHTERTTDRPPKHQSARRAYVASLATRGKISHKGLGTRNWPFSGSVKVQRMRRRGATAWTMYTFIYPIRKILRISEVQKVTRGWTMNWYWNIRFDPSATQGRTDIWCSGYNNITR